VFTNAPRRLERDGQMSLKTLIDPGLVRGMLAS